MLSRENRDLVIEAEEKEKKRKAKEEIKVSYIRGLYNNTFVNVASAGFLDQAAGLSHSSIPIRSRTTQGRCPPPTTSSSSHSNKRNR